MNQKPKQRKVEGVRPDPTPLDVTGNNRQQDGMRPGATRLYAFPSTALCYWIHKTGKLGIQPNPRRFTGLMR